MSNFFKSKFSKEKMAKFFDREGFYIVLFLCVCIVAITAVWVSRTGVKNDQSPAEVPDNKTTVESPVKETTSNTGSDTKLPAKDESKAATEEHANVTEAENTESAETVKSDTPAVNVTFMSPVKDGMKNGNVTRDYSSTEMVYYETPNAWMTHLGLDMKSTEGSEVLAAAKGKVVDVRNDNDYEGGMGWTVVLDHGNGYRTVYSNLGEVIDVKKDDTVKQGERIGVISNSSILEKEAAQDNPAMSHLHFEVLKKNAKSYESVDPKKYLIVQQ